MRVAIYSAVFGDYDRPGDAAPQDERVPAEYDGAVRLPVRRYPLDVDWILFADDELSVRPPNGWQVTLSSPTHEHPRLTAKWFKMNPGVVLRGYDVTIYLDGSIHVGSPLFARAMADVLAETPSGIALCRHPHRSDIWSEAEASIPMAKYDGQRIAEQMQRYRDAGFESTELWAGGVVVRDNRREDVHEFGRAWMAENLIGSYQDQLSLPVVLARLGITPGVIPLDVYRNVLWEWVAHDADKQER